MGALESACRALSNEPMLFYLINIHRATTPYMEPTIVNMFQVSEWMCHQ